MIANDNTAVLEWRSYSYFPYERDFARLETRQLFGVEGTETVDGLRIPEPAFRAEAAERLTYFARATHPSGKVVIPHQTRLEASAHHDGRARQATRYSAHGLHEYKGKFNPQVVRAIGNILGLQEGAVVLDPFCGSGTTLLECAHAGWSARGIDRNPLAVRIAKAKLRAVRLPGGQLEEYARKIVSETEAVAESLSGTEEISCTRLEMVLGAGWERELVAREYLESWFTLPVLAQIVAARRAIRRHVPEVEDRSIFDVLLSDHLRDVSLQEPGDLRIRRRKNPLPNYPLLEDLSRAIRERVARIVRAREVLGEVRAEQDAQLSDIRRMHLAPQRALESRYDAIITSPPYETALPYVDTQRLSLVLFGDITPDEIYGTERELIGAREIGTKERRKLEEEIRTGATWLPRDVIDVCRELLAASLGPGNGFRRAARPALVYRYFRNMADFFTNVRGVLRSGGKLALVVGPNRATLGGKEFVINTPGLLAAVAMHVGYELVDERPMDAYPRYDMHRKNSIESERLIVLTV